MSKKQKEKPHWLVQMPIPARCITCTHAINDAENQNDPIDGLVSCTVKVFKGGLPWLEAACCDCNYWYPAEEFRGVPHEETNGPENIPIQ